MSFRFNIPSYTSKDAPIAVSSMFILTLIINYIVFESYFSDLSIFFWGTLVTFGVLIPVFFTYGLVAISLRSRFPEDSETIIRITICICIFLLLSAVIIALILIGYEATGFLNYKFSEADYSHCYIAAIVMNLFLIFLNEGVAQFERYMATSGFLSTSIFIILTSSPSLSLASFKMGACILHGPHHSAKKVNEQRFISIN